MKTLIQALLVLGLSASSGLLLAQPGTFIDLGTLSDTSPVYATADISNTQAYAAGEVRWYRFVVAEDCTNANGVFLDFDTTGAGITDTEIGLYSNSGTLIASDDDDGDGTYSALSFGQTSPARGPIGTGVAGNGRDGQAVVAGTYWLAVVAYNATFSAAWTVTTTSTATGNITLFVRTNVSIPGDPEIRLEFPSGTVISTGTTLNVGTATPGVMAPYTFTVRNTGATQNLTVSGISASPTGVANCTVSTTALAPASPVPAGSSATFNLQLTPTAIGPFECTLVVNNNDANEGTYTIVVQGFAPNDTIASAAPLTLNREVTGTVTGFVNDYQIQAASTKFLGLVQTVTTAPGRDAVYSFTAPSAGNYSFRVHFGTTSNYVIYLIDTAPAGAPPVTITDTNILAASNRNTVTANGAEELFNIALAASQVVYLVVDEVTLTAGGTFAVEVTNTVLESEPNDTPATATVNPHGKTASFGTAAEADFYALGSPGAGSRVFAMTDSAAANSTDTVLRVTTDTDTLEWDDDGADAPFAGLASVIAGTPTNGRATYLRVNLLSTTTLSEPYRLYSVVQPDASLATAESEPNETIGQASSGANNYFAGVMASTTDVDIYTFTAALGDLIFVAADFDPTRTNLPWNGILALLDASGNVLLQVNDGGATSNTASGAGSLTATTPSAPADGLVWRARAAGTYYVRITYSSGTANRAYLLSISKNGIADGATAPNITSAAPAGGVVGTPYSHQFVAVGAPTFFTWAVSAGSLPGGLSLDPNSGLLSGTPTAPGNFNFTVTASNGVGSPGPQVVNMTITEAPAFTSSPVTSAATTVPYSYTPTASGFPAPTITVVSTLPSWLSFTGGTLSGTPQASDVAGSPYAISLQASNAAGTDTQNFQIVVTLSNQLPRANPDTAVSSPVFTGTADTGPFGFTVDPNDTVSSRLIVDDPDATDQVQVVNIVPPATNIGVTASAPSGLAASVDVDFTGTIDPAVAPGMYTWTIFISDDASTPGTRTITVNITVANIAPDGFSQPATGVTGTGVDLANAYARSFNQTATVAATDLFSVSDANTGQTMSVVSSNRTGGSGASTFPFSGQFAINGTAGSFTVSVSTVAALAATDVGTHEHEVIISDGSAQITVFVTLTVAAQTPPTFTPNGTPASIGQGGFAAGVVAGVAADAQDSASALAVAATTVPSGINVTSVAINGTTGEVTCTISVGAAVAPGSYGIGFTVTDSFSMTGGGTYNFNVAANALPTITAGAAISMGQSVTLTGRTLATVSDADQAAGTLSVAVIVTPPGITVGALTNTAGVITADVTSSASIAAGIYNVTLEVTDAEGATATTNLPITIVISSGGGGGGGGGSGGGCSSGAGYAPWLAALALLAIAATVRRRNRAQG